MQAAVRVFYQGELHARNSFGSASGESAGDNDAPVQRDQEGHPMLAGTGLAGVLRSLSSRCAGWMGEVACDPNHTGGGCGECLCCSLFGSAKTAASHLFVDHARMHPEDRVLETEKRERVSIERCTRTASPTRSQKFNRELVPAGARFLLRLEHHLPESEAEQVREEALLAQTLALLMEREDGVPFGGGTGVGLGCLRLQNLRSRRLDLRSPADLEILLAGRQDPDQPVELPTLLARATALPPSTAAPGRRPAQVTFRGRLRPLGPLLVQATIEQSPRNPQTPPQIEGVEVQPIERRDMDADFFRTSCVRDNKRQSLPCLPGSGLKGVLRTHAEAILRTRGCTACDPACRTSEPLQACDSRLNTRNLDLEDPEVVFGPHGLCPACTLFGSTLAAGALVPDDALPRHPEAFVSRLKHLDFVSLDRWTQAPRDQARFDARVFFPHSLDDEFGDLDFCLRLDLRERFSWHLAMVAFLLRDLAAGRLHFGYGKQKGQGRVRLLLDQVEWEGPADSSAWGVQAQARGWVGRATWTAQEGADRLWFLDPDAPPGQLLRRGLEAWASLRPGGAQ